MSQYIIHSGRLIETITLLKSCQQQLKNAERLIYKDENPLSFQAMTDVSRILCNMKNVRKKLNRLDDALAALQKALIYIGDKSEDADMIDKDIADLTAQNLVLTKLHNKGILSVTDFNAQAEELNGKIKELRAKRKKTLSEDENDELLDTLRGLNEMIAEYEKSPRFDEELFEQIIESTIMVDNNHITFILIGGIKLTEKIDRKGRRGTA